MCIQTPGSLVWAGSLAAREGLKGWSVWGVLLVTALLQGSLLVMAIYFEYFGPNNMHKGDVTHDEGEHDGRASGNGATSSGRSEMPPQGPIHAELPSEETPLLRSQ